MKNLNIRKKLLALLLTGTIVLTTTGCSNKKDSNNHQMYIVPEPVTEITTEQESEKEDDFSKDTEPVPEKTEILPDPLVPEKGTLSTGTVELNEAAIRILTTNNGYTLVRRSNYLELIEGDLTNIKDNNPLYSYQEITGKGTTTTEVNFRLAPLVANDNKIDTISANVNVNVLGRTDDNWYLVDYKGTLGFLKGDYLRILTYNVDDNYELTENTIKIVPAVKATTNVKIREQATTESKQLDLLKEGQVIKMIQLLSNGWYEVEYKGGLAYICGDYVKEVEKVEGNCYKVGYLKNDSYIYDAPNGNAIDVVPQYESGEIFAADNNYYLVSTSDGIVGYINKSDIGILTDTAVIVDISSQTLTVYKDNEVVLTSPVVSGRLSDGRESDYGIFTIKSKETNRYLTDNKTYNSFVNYWMPYNGGEGLHDATWRSSFGGTIYKKSGSHGCVNLPLETAEQVYGIVHTKDNVLVKR